MFTEGANLFSLLNCFLQKCLFEGAGEKLSCQVLPFGCMRQSTGLRGRQTDDTRGQRNRIFEGWAYYNAVAY